MNETQTRSRPSSLSAYAMPMSVCVAIASGAVGGRIPLSKSPTCRSRPPIGVPSLPACTSIVGSGSGSTIIITGRSRMTGPITSSRSGNPIPTRASIPQARNPFCGDGLPSQRTGCVSNAFLRYVSSARESTIVRYIRTRSSGVSARRNSARLKKPRTISASVSR